MAFPLSFRIDLPAPTLAQEPAGLERLMTALAEGIRARGATAVRRDGASLQFWVDRMPEPFGTWDVLTLVASGDLRVTRDHGDIPRLQGTIELAQSRVFVPATLAAFLLCGFLLSAWILIFVTAWTSAFTVSRKRCREWLSTLLLECEGRISLRV